MAPRRVILTCVAVFGLALASLAFLTQHRAHLFANVPNTPSDLTTRERVTSPSGSSGRTEPGATGGLVCDLGD